MTGSWIWAFREGKPAAAFPLVCSLAQDGNRVKSAKDRPPALALDAVLVLCYPSPGRWEKRSIGTRSQLQNEAVHGAWGQRPQQATWDIRVSGNPRFGLGGSHEALLAGFSYPVFLPFRAVFLPRRKRGRLHILLLIIRVFQFDGSVNDTFHNGQILFRAKL